MNQFVLNEIKMIVPGYTHRNLKNNLLNDENEYLSGKETK
jgi:hypothetical protein